MQAALVAANDEWGHFVTSCVADVAVPHPTQPYTAAAHSAKTARLVAPLVIPCHPRDTAADPTESPTHQSYSATAQAAKMARLDGPFGIPWPPRDPADGLPDGNTHPVQTYAAHAARAALQAQFPTIPVQPPSDQGRSAAVPIHAADRQDMLTPATYPLCNPRYQPTGSVAGSLRPAEPMPRYSASPSMISAWSPSPYAPMDRVSPCLTQCPSPSISASFLAFLEDSLLLAPEPCSSRGYTPSLDNHGLQAVNRLTPIEDPAGAQGPSDYSAILDY